MSNTSPGRRSSRGRKQAVVRRSRTPTDVSRLEAHLGYWLRTVSNHVSHAFKTKVERHGATVAEWVVLRALLDGDEIMPSELAATLGLTRGAVSKLVDRLAAKDLVAVRGDALDGRAQRIALTATGRRVVPKLAALADANDAEAFGHLEEERRTFLLETLKQVADRLGLRGAPVD